MQHMARVLWAKKSVTEVGDLWLPLHVHMSDSAETARFIWSYWVPEGTKKAISSGISPSEEDEDLAERVFSFLCAGHDLGKATPVFQAKERFVSRHLDAILHQRIREAGLPLGNETAYSERSASHHSVAGHAILRRFGFRESVAVVLGAHHGKPPGTGQLKQLEGYAENTGFNDQNWRTIQEELLDYALMLGGLTKPIAESLDLGKPAQVLLSGLIILVDWIASDESLYPLIELYENRSNSRERAKHAELSLNLTPCWSTDRDWNQLYKRRFGIDDPRPIQEEVLQITKTLLKPGILVVEAPMGEGKTEAALAAAEIMAAITGRGGVYFALPTQATSDAMLSRVCRWIEHLDGYGGMHTILLAHGKADFNQAYRKIKLSERTRIGDTEGAEMDNAVIVHEWLSGRKKGLLADFVIGTIDHVLMAGLKHKHVMLRHLGLSNKVVIIDECHAYDAYMSQYLKIVLRWLGAYGVPVIVLSATLPQNARRQLVEAYLNQKDAPAFDPVCDDGKPTPDVPGWAESREYPLITYTDGQKINQKSVTGPSRSLSIMLRCIPDDSVVGSLKRMLSNGGCVGLVLNTVKRAQSLYQELAAQFGNECVRIVHSRFISIDRAAKEEELQALLGPPEKPGRPEKLIVVGTQVLEQSLDFDFDLLITDICPMDLLLQRMGRLHRHDRPRPDKLKEPVCLVLGIHEDGFDAGAEKIYGKYLLMRTKALLQEKIKLPEAIASLVHDTYSDADLATRIAPSVNEEYQAAKEAHRKLVEKKESKARTFQVSEPLRSLPTLVGWLDTVVEDGTGKRGEATVRDAADSIEVIVVQKVGNEIQFLPWLKIYGRERIPRDHEPDDEMACALVGCSIRLPPLFGAPWMVDRVITELEDACRSEGVQSWQRSRWLKGELILFLNDHLEAAFCGYHFKYDQRLGLMSQKTEE